MNVLLGVSGGVACYKACGIITEFKKKNHSVRVVLTENAKQFVTPVTFSSLTGQASLSDFWNEASGGAIDHIGVVQKWAHVLLVAPATANVIGKFANGIADDYLSTIFMAATCPKVIAPAMNTTMWESPAVQRNIATLKEDGVVIINPIEGILACGTKGIGKLQRADIIFDTTYFVGKK